MQSLANRIHNPRVAVLIAIATVLLGASATAQNPLVPSGLNESSAIGRTNTGLLQLHVREADLAAVLRLLSQEEQVNIVAGPGVSGTVTADLYNVTLEEALTAILRSQGLMFERHGKFIHVMSADEWSRVADSRRVVESRVFELKYVTSTEAAALIKPVLSDIGQVAQTTAAASGISSGTSDTGGDSLATADTLVVVDFVENLSEAAKVLEQIDKRPRQVLIEATILRATLRETDELGIDFNTLGGIDFRSLNSISPGVTDIATGVVPQNQLDDPSATVRTDFNANVSGGGFTFGLITNQVSVFLRALEAITDVTVMANPKVLALNKQRGEVIVGRRDGYLTTTVTETAAVQTVEFLETGTQLIFRPYIGDEGWVRMEIHPEDSNGGLSSTDLPFEETTEATANIMVRDGQTIVIGGLFRERSSSAKDQVPFLGSVPWLGVLFKRTADDTAREEVIILLTVHVLKDSPGESDMMASLLDDAERIRVGARRELMPFGRERLAQAHYRWAWTHLSRGNVDRAMADVRMALYHNPRFINAQKLQEELLGRRLWDDESTRSRTFMYDLVRNEDGAMLERLERPDPYDSGAARLMNPTTVPNSESAP